MFIENKKGEFVKEHRIIVPFSPHIYQTMLNAEDLKFLQEFAELSRTGTPIGSMLSGNIIEQRGADFIGRNSEDMRRRMLALLTPHIQEYFKICQFLEKANQPIRLKDDPLLDYEKMNFHLGNGTWFNYMRANEFNPSHSHSGMISGIAMIEIPEEIASEDKKIPIDSNARCPGALEWMHGSWGSGAYRKYPVTGELYMFPSELRHQVYPFKSDVERITMSWNVFDITFG